MQQTLKNPPEILTYLNSLIVEDQSGEVLFQCAQGSAKVYLHRSLIVWAFATGQQESFQSILVRENHLSKEALLSGIKEAREKGKKSLDEILLALGITETNAREGIIFRHTRAALKTICQWSDCTAQFNKYSHPTPQGVSGLTLQALLDGIQTPREEGNKEKVVGPTGTAKFKRPVANRPSYAAEELSEKVDDIDSLLNQLRSEIPNFIAAIIIDGQTGMPIASISDAAELDTEAVSAFSRNLSEAAVSMLQTMGKDSKSLSALEEVLVTAKEEYILLQTIEDGKQILYVLIDKNSNPAMTRVVIKRYLSQLSGFLN